MLKNDEDNKYNKNIEDNFDLKKKDCKYILENLHVNQQEYTSIIHQTNYSYVTYYLCKCANCSCINTIAVINK